VAYLQGRDVEITIDLALGHGSATVWTGDLTTGNMTLMDRIEIVRT
jgi:N-acetylglutamate synthase/N-acetylornithine aminotransferase